MPPAPNAAVVVLPGPAEVDEGQEVVVEVFGTGRSGKRFRLARDQLGRGPLLHTLRYELPLQGFWNLRVRVLRHDGTRFEGWGALRIKPVARTSFMGVFREGVHTFKGLARDFEEIHLELFPGARQRLALERPDEGETVELSVTLPQPWMLTLQPRFESAPQPPVRIIAQMTHAVDPAHRAYWAQGKRLAEGSPWILRGMGDGRWRVRILAVGKRPRKLWEETLTLGGGDEVTLTPCDVDGAGCTTSHNSLLLDASDRVRAVPG